MKINNLFECEVQPKSQRKKTIQENNSHIKRYVIEAGTNKYDRKQYISFYNDCDEFSISSVPSVGSKDKVDKIFTLVIQKYNTVNEKSFNMRQKINPVIVEAPEYICLPVID